MTEAHYRVEELLAQSDWVRRLAYAIAGNPHDADDLHQDAMQAALVRPPARSGSLHGWFARVVRNRWLETRRSDKSRRAREQRNVGEGVGAGAGEEAQRLESSRLVIEELQSLEEPYRTVLLKIYFGGMRAADVARELGCPADTVRSHHRRGLERLRQNWGRKRKGREAYLAALLPLLRWGEPPPAADFAGLDFPPMPRFPGELALVGAAVLFLALVGVATLGPPLFQSDSDDAAVATAPSPEARTRGRRAGDAPKSDPSGSKGEDATTREAPPRVLEPRVDLAVRGPDGVDLASATVRITAIDAYGNRLNVPGVAIVNGRLAVPRAEILRVAPDAEELEVIVDHPECAAETLYAPLFWAHPLPPGAAREGEAKLARALRVRGSLVDEAGQGLRSVTVRAFDGGGGSIPKVKAESTTDASGGFVLRVAEPGRYLVGAMPEGRRPIAAYVSVTSDAGGDAGRLTAPEGFAVSGVVRDARERPLEGVYVGVSIQRQRQVRSLSMPLGPVSFRDGECWRGHVMTSTAADGSYTIGGLGAPEAYTTPYDLRVGALQIPHQLHVRREGIAPGAQADAKIDGLPAELIFRSGNSASGGGVRVSVERGDEKLCAADLDGSGRTRFVLPSDVPLRVRAERRGEATQAFDLVVSAARDDPFYFELLAEPDGATLEVRLPDPDGKALRRASFALLDPAEGGPFSLEFDTRVIHDARRGVFLVKGMPPGDWELWVFPGGRASARSFVMPVRAPLTVPESGHSVARLPATAYGGRLRLEVRKPDGRLAPSGSMLTLLRDGEPVPCDLIQNDASRPPNAAVQFDRPATSDRALAPGSYELRVVHTDYGNARATLEIEAGRTTTVELTLRR